MPLPSWQVPDFNLQGVEFVVFDEADRLFEMGFADQLRDLLVAMPEQRQCLLFSATMPKALVHFARAGLTDPQLVRLDTDTKVACLPPPQGPGTRSADNRAPREQARCLLGGRQ